MYQTSLFHEPSEQCCFVFCETEKEYKKLITHLKPGYTLLESMKLDNIEVKDLSEVIDINDELVTG